MGRQTPGAADGCSLLGKREGGREKGKTDRQRFAPGKTALIRGSGRKKKMAHPSPFPLPPSPLQEFHHEAVLHPDPDPCPDRLCRRPRLSASRRGYSARLQGSPRLESRRTAGRNPARALVGGLRRYRSQRTRQPGGNLQPERAAGCRAIPAGARPAGRGAGRLLPDTRHRPFGYPRPSGGCAQRQSCPGHHRHDPFLAQRQLGN